MSLPQLTVTLFPQLTDMWCWAASAEMVMDYAGTSVSQCAQANAEFGMSNCCEGPTPSTCVQGGYPDFAYWGFSSQTTPYGTALTWAELSEQFTLGQPVAYAWSWVGGGGHVMVATGVWVDPEEGSLVDINNPWPPNQGDQTTLTYALYVSDPGSYTHQMDWYNIVPAPSTSATRSGRHTLDPGEGAHDE